MFLRTAQLILPQQNLLHYLINVVRAGNIHLLIFRKPYIHRKKNLIATRVTQIYKIRAISIIPVFFLPNVNSSIPVLKAFSFVFKWLIHFFISSFATIASLPALHSKKGGTRKVVQRIIIQYHALGLAQVACSKWGVFHLGSHPHVKSLSPPIGSTEPWQNDLF
jgi:hypothetical protein